MKRRVAKKIVARTRRASEGKSGGIVSRRDLVIQAHRMLGVPVPAQEPGPIAIEPKVSSPGTSNAAVQNDGKAVAAISLTTSDVDLTNLTNMRVPELKALCKESGLKGYSKLNREGLVELLHQSL